MEGDGMQVFNLFSKRNKEFQTDVLQYDVLPEKFRNQVYYIWKYALGIDRARSSGSKSDNAFTILRDTMCREHGLRGLHRNNYMAYLECESYLKEETNTERVLDIIELSIQLIPAFRRSLQSYELSSYGISMSQKEAIEDLNNRFKENGIGYEFSNGILIRKDSQYIHEEVTKPALHLLQEEGFEGALAEFLEAHDHFRKGEHKSCISSASNAFESTMKTICAKQKWKVDGTGTSSQLIRAIVDNELVPKYLESYMASLRGLSTVRNKKVGHGQGENDMPVPEHFVNYALHLCATNIVFLVEAYRELPKKG